MAPANEFVLEFIDPETPTQSAFAEIYSGRLRDECLNKSRLVNLPDAWTTIEA